VIDESARTIRRDWSRIPVANPSALLSAVAVTRTFASMYCTASQTDCDTSMTGAGDEGAAGVAAPAIALGAWILLTPAMFSGTVLAPSRWHEPRDARGSRRRSWVAPS
jgi:hypothetical protein